MTVSETGKYLYWMPGETVDVKMTEIYTVRKYKKKEDYTIGEAVWKHFKAGESPVVCTNDRKCPACRAGMKPVIRFNTGVVNMEDGEEYFSELPISLSRILAEKQIAFQEAGMSDEDILDKVYSVKRLEKPLTPFWEVKTVSVKGKKPKKKVDLDELMEEEEEEEEPKANKVEALTDEEIDQVDDLIAKLEVKLDKSPDYEWKALAEKTLKKLFKDKNKIDEALALIDVTLNGDTDD